MLVQCLSPSRSCWLRPACSGRPASCWATRRCGTVTGRGRTAKHDPRRKKNQTRTEAVVALTWAASQGDLNEVRALIATGADPQPADRWGGTPLTDAETNGHTQIAELLAQATHKKEVAV